MSETNEKMIPVWRRVQLIQNVPEGEGKCWKRDDDVTIEASAIEQVVDRRIEERERQNWERFKAGCGTGPPMPDVPSPDSEFVDESETILADGMKVRMEDNSVPGQSSTLWTVIPPEPVREITLSILLVDGEQKLGGAWYRTVPPADDTEFVEVVRELFSNREFYELIEMVEEWRPQDGFLSEHQEKTYRDLAKVKSLLPAEDDGGSSQWGQGAFTQHQCEKCRTMLTTFYHGRGWLCDKHAPERASGGSPLAVGDALRVIDTTDEKDLREAAVEVVKTRERLRELKGDSFASVDIVATTMNAYSELCDAVSDLKKALGPVRIEEMDIDQ